MRLAGLLVCVCVTTAGSAATRGAGGRSRPAVPGAPPAAAADVGTAADWNAPPTNGSPGVDVPKLSGNELLGNTDFAAKTYLPWTTSFTPPGDGKAFLKDGQFCVTVTNKGKDPWDAQARHREMVIQKGHVYSIKYTAHATKPVQVKTKVGMSGPPHKEYWADTVDLTTRPQAFVGVFSMEEDDDATAELAFHFGGAMAGETQAPYTVCFDDIHLDDPKFVKAKKTDDAPIPNVLVNQTGYLPALPKLATIKSASKTPLKWELLKHGGAVVASGDTKPVGMDAASGDDVHIVDFSSVTAPGKGYTLKVGADTSHPFDIAADTYRKLKYDALAIFYHQRSGIDIAMPYAGGKQWTRPAGHVNVKANDPVKASPNTGDKAVPCLKDSGCDYKLDVTRRLVRRGRSRQIRRQRRHLDVDDAEPVRARGGARHGGAVRRRQARHPGEEEQDARHPRRGALADGVHAQDAGPRRPAEGRDGAPQDPRPGVDGDGDASRRGSASRASCGRRRRRRR